MKKSLKYFAVSALLLIALLIGLSRLNRHAAIRLELETNAVVAVEDGVPPSAGSSAPLSTTPRFLKFIWQAGAAGSYQFEASTRLAGSPETLKEGEPTRLGGKLQFAVLKVNSQRVTIAVALRDSYYVSGGERVTRVEEMLNATPAVLTLTLEGKLLTLAFPRESNSRSSRAACCRLR